MTKDNKDITLPVVGLLTVIFIFLKVTNTVDWSWVWVLCPLWIPTALVIGITAVTSVLYVFATACGVVIEIIKNTINTKK